MLYVLRGTPTVSLGLSLGPDIAADALGLRVGSLQYRRSDEFVGLLESASNGHLSFWQSVALRTNS